MNATPTRMLLALFLAALLAVPAGYSVARAAAAEDEEEESAAKAEGAAADTELAKQMEQIEDAMKKLRRTLKKPEDNAKSLELVAQMQQAAVASKSQTPAMAAGVPEAERQKFVQGYRKDMSRFIADMCQLEIDLLDGDNAKAVATFEKLKKWEDDGHEKYTE